MKNPREIRQRPFRPRRELAEAMVWYDERCGGLGLNLLAEFQKAAHSCSGILNIVLVTSASVIISNAWSAFPT